MEFPDWEGGVEVVWQGVGQLPRVHGQRLLSVAEQLRLPRNSSRQRAEAFHLEWDDTYLAAFKKG